MPQLDVSVQRLHDLLAAPNLRHHVHHRTKHPEDRQRTGEAGDSGADCVQSPGNDTKGRRKGIIGRRGQLRLPGQIQHENRCRRQHNGAHRPVYLQKQRRVKLGLHGWTIDSTPLCKGPLFRATHRNLLNAVDQAEGQAGFLGICVHALTAQVIGLLRHHDIQGTHQHSDDQRSPAQCLRIAKHLEKADQRTENGQDRRQEHAQQDADMVVESTQPGAKIACGKTPHLAHRCGQCAHHESRLQGNGHARGYAR